MPSNFAQKLAPILDELTTVRVALTQETDRGCAVIRRILFRSRIGHVNPAHISSTTRIRKSSFWKDKADCRHSLLESRLLSQLAAFLEMFDKSWI